MGGVGRRIPSWIRFSVPGGGRYPSVKRVIDEQGLHTVCIEARCPNIGECFGNGTATFLILGDVCTRNCRYCAVTSGVPALPDAGEPDRVAEAVRRLELVHAVITSVTRDDLPDGGASHFTAVIERIRELGCRCGIELLVPDFSGSMERSMDAIAARRPDVLNHNIEVAGPLYEALRPMGSYGASLRLLRHASSAGLRVKSGFMVGFGETMEDIRRTLDDLRMTGCEHVTIGQYLQSRRENYPVARYYTQEEFQQIAAAAGEAGFPVVQCGPLVRSSYHAAAHAAGCGRDAVQAR
ncbi:MAG: lipoyl synthase [Spirochaetes bacterium]|nr:lipoyl synthase [Spirochaetota bacterium]